MVDVQLILWDIKYFDPLHTACKAQNRYINVRVDTARYPVFRDSILDILHADNEKTKTTNTVHALMPAFSLRCCFFRFFLFLSFCYHFPPFWIVHFPFDFFRVTRWCVQAVASCPDIMSFLFPSPFSFSFWFSFFRLNWIRIDGVTQWLFDRDPHSVLKAQGWMALSSCRVVTEHGWVSLPLYEVYSRGQYFLYKAICSIFGGSMLLIQSNTQYFQRIDTTEIKQYAVFSGGGYCLYQAIRSIFGESILRILRNTQYFRGSILKGTGAYYVKITSIILSVYQYLYCTGRTLVNLYIS